MTMKRREFITLLGGAATPRMGRAKDTGWLYVGEERWRNCV
jgi:hypothetical protein